MVVFHIPPVKTRKIFAIILCLDSVSEECSNVDSPLVLMFPLSSEHLLFSRLLSKSLEVPEEG